MIMIEISDRKMDTMAEYAEKVLKYAGKLMQMLDEEKGEDSDDKD